MAGWYELALVVFEGVVRPGEKRRWQRFATRLEARLYGARGMAPALFTRHGGRYIGQDPLTESEKSSLRQTLRRGERATLRSDEDL